MQAAVSQRRPSQSESARRFLRKLGGRPGDPLLCCRGFCVVLGFALVSNFSAGGANADEPTKSPAFRVTGAKSAAGGNVVELRQTIEVTLDDLDGYLASVKKSPAELVLFIDSRPIARLTPWRVATTDDDKNKLRVDLRSLGGNDPAKSNKASWAALLGSPCLCLDETRSFAVTVGTEGQPLASTAKVDFVVVPRFWAQIGLVVVLIVTVGLLMIAAQSDVLRDPGPAPLLHGRPQVKAFSLSRVQLAIWLWSIITSYVFIWVMIGETASLTGQVLGILGINGATLVGSAIIDNRQRTLTASQAAAQTQQASEKAQEVAAQAQHAAAQAREAAAQAPQGTAQTPQAAALAQLAAVQVQQAVTQVQAAQAPRTPQPATATQSFFVDILSDKNGVSLDRFQAFAWTVVMIVVFVVNVWQSLTMPEFNEYLLALMGLSSGTYVTMKANT